MTHRTPNTRSPTTPRHRRSARACRRMAAAASSWTSLHITVGDRRRRRLVPAHRLGEPRRRPSARSRAGLLLTLGCRPLVRALNTASNAISSAYTTMFGGIPASEPRRGPNGLDATSTRSSAPASRPASICRTSPDARSSTATDHQILTRRVHARITSAPAALRRWLAAPAASSTTAFARNDPRRGHQLRRCHTIAAGDRALPDALDPSLDCRSRPGLDSESQSPAAPRSGTEPQLATRPASRSSTTTRALLVGVAAAA